MSQMLYELVSGRFVRHERDTPNPGTRANSKTNSRPEIALRAALHATGLRFRKNYPIKVDVGRAINVDIAFVSGRVAVFVDGCFWHGCPLHGRVPQSNRDYWVPKLERNMQRDRADTRRLQSASWEVIRVWEHEPVHVAAEFVAAVLRAPAPLPSA